MQRGSQVGLYRALARIYGLAEGWRTWVARIARAASRRGCRVYVFGSVIEGTATPSSDVDVLVVCREVPRNVFERARIVAEIEEEAGLPPAHPFEIHLASEDELDWYVRLAGRIMPVG